MKFNTVYMDRSKKQNGESNTEPSLTVPNMAMTLAEIFQRHVQGRPVPAKKAFYGGDTFYPNPKGLTDMDKYDMIKALEASNAEKMETINEQRKLKLQELKARKIAQRAEQQAAINANKPNAVTGDEAQSG